MARPKKKIYYILSFQKIELNMLWGLLFVCLVLDWVCVRGREYVN